MVFLDWHYTEGIKFYFKYWRGIAEKIIRFFSLPILFTSLFAPWKRISIESKASLNISSFFDELSFNLTSRLVGFFVRFWLIVIGLGFLILSIPAGLLGLVLWLLVPILSIPVYQKMQKSPEVFSKKLLKSINNSENPTCTLFDNEAGEFVLTHVGLTVKDVVERAVKHLVVESTKHTGYSDILTTAMESGVWPAELWRDLGIQSEDLIIAARIWDEKRRIASDISKLYASESTKGIGIELLYGYTPIIDKTGKDLLHQKGLNQPLRGRDDTLARIERILESNGSVLVVGQPGVGKKAILIELAKRLDERYKKLTEINIVQLTTGQGGVNEKKYIIQRLLSEAAKAGNIIIVLRDLPRLTNVEFEGIDFTDVFEERMELKGAQIIAVVTPEEYEKYLARNHRLMKHFEKVQVDPLSSEAAIQVLIDKAAMLETSSHLTIPIPVLRNMVVSTDRYYSDLPFPKKALELLESAASYVIRQGRDTITTEDVSIVVSEKTGLPPATLDAGHKRKLANIESLMQEKLVGQESALSMIAQSLRSRSLGVSESNKPVGTFLFLGPTGVGKTETAKILSSIYYGHTDIMRFDMAEFVGYEGVTKMIGSAHMNQPGILTTAIKNNPAGLVLFDELEKASEEVFNILLTMIDEGYIVDAFGKKIDCRNVFVIATSNAGSEMIRKLVRERFAGEELQRQVLEHVLAQRIFSPEFVNRFDGVVVYEPLSKAHLTEIAKIKLSDLKNRMLEKNIHIHLNDDIYSKVAEDGYDPVFGARPMRRVVDMVISDAISQAMLTDYIKPGDKVTIHAGEEKHKYFLEKV